MLLLCLMTSAAGDLAKATGEARRSLSPAGAGESSGETPVSPETCGARAEAPLATMDVASVNVWGLPNILHPRFGNGERLGGALGRYLEGAAHFDVVAVQELWGNLWRRDATAAHPLFPRLNIHPTSRDGDSGLAFGTAERRWHTKTAPDARPFVHRGRAADALKHKGFARVTMVADADGEPIEVVVVNTHLQATNLWNEIGRAHV